MAHNIITRNEAILLLTELESKGINIQKQLNAVIKNPIVPIDTIKFINNNRPLEIGLFYEKLRKAYNKKKSKVYVQIVTEIEDRNPQDILTTLSALQLQIILFSKDVTDTQLFLKHSRMDSILECLSNYIKTYDLIPCVQLLSLIKADLKLFESLT